MEPINIEELQRFTGADVEVKIQDQQGGEQAPAVTKIIKKIQCCPDRTHVRFFFDNVHFLAIPLESDVCETDDSFSASDSESGLTYTIKKVQVSA